MFLFIYDVLPSIENQAYHTERNLIRKSDFGSRFVGARTVVH